MKHEEANDSLQMLHIECLSGSRSSLSQNRNKTCRSHSLKGHRPVHSSQPILNLLDKKNYQANGDKSKNYKWFEHGEPSIECLMLCFVCWWGEDGIPRNFVECLMNVWVEKKNHPKASRPSFNVFFNILRKLDHIKRIISQCN